MRDIHQAEKYFGIIVKSQTNSDDVENFANGFVIPSDLRRTVVGPYDNNPLIELHVEGRGVKKTKFWKPINHFWNLFLKVA